MKMFATPTLALLVFASSTFAAAETVDHALAPGQSILVVDRYGQNLNISCQTAVAKNYCVCMKRGGIWELQRVRASGAAPVILDAFTYQTDCDARRQAEFVCESPQP